MAVIGLPAVSVLFFRLRGERRPPLAVSSDKNAEVRLQLRRSIERAVGETARRATSPAGRESRDFARTHPKSVIPPSTTGRSQLPLPLAGEGRGGGSSVSGLFKILWFDAGYARHPGGVSATRDTTGKIRWRRRNPFHVKRVAESPAPSVLVDGPPPRPSPASGRRRRRHTLCFT